MEHRVAQILVVATFFLILLGGIVHNTASSLACPDWPLCYGSLLPEMTGKVAIEHSHRLVATAIGLGTILLFLLLRKKRGGSTLTRWGAVALFLVVAQGLLGGITVLYQLPTLVSTAHLATSMLYFATLIVIACKTSPHAKEGPQNSPLILSSALLVFFQMLLGALVRHTGAGLVCPDIPWCYGRLWPMAGVPMQLQMAHRWGGILVALLILTLTVRYWGKNPTPVRYQCVGILGLVFLQIGLGALSVWTLLGIPAVTAHLGIAALLWGSLIGLWQRGVG